jgi:hypothetical protein
MIYCSSCGSGLSDTSKFCRDCGAPVPGHVAGKAKEVEKTRPAKVQVKEVYHALDTENLGAGYVVNGRYEVLEKKGRGNFGTVYRVLDRETGTVKALKVLSDMLTKDLESLGDIRRAVDNASRLDHPGIARIYGFHGERPIAYIEMDYVAGKELGLRKFEVPHRKFPEAKVLDDALSVAGALAYAQGLNVFHRDISPKQILVTDDGAMKLMDYGVSEVIRNCWNRFSRSYVPVPSTYMSPEQIRGQAYTCESEVYSFGVLLYELLSGNPPFFKGDITHQVFSFEPPRIEGVSKPMNDFLQRCLTKDPGGRYHSFGEVLDALGKMAIGVFPADGNDGVVPPERIGTALSDMGPGPAATPDRPGWMERVKHGILARIRWILPVLVMGGIGILAARMGGKEPASQGPRPPVSGSVAVEMIWIEPGPVLKGVSEDVPEKTDDVMVYEANGNGGENGGLGFRLIRVP